MKLFNYIFIMVGTLILFNALGYTTPSGGLVGSLVLDSSNFSNGTGTGNKLVDIQSSSLYSKLIIAISIAAGVGIVAGLLTSTVPVSYLVGAFLTLLLGLFLTDILWLYQKLVEVGATWQVYLATAIFGPLIVGFVIAAIEWWQGSG